jgi:hypothetical protein
LQVEIGPRVSGKPCLYLILHYLCGSFGVKTSLVEGTGEENEIERNEERRTVDISVSKDA